MVVTKVNEEKLVQLIPVRIHC